MAKPVVLTILDGFGISFEKKGNALALAKTPNFDEISENYPGALLQASGIEVGLDWGEMGNSEVGHANIGSGTVVYQNLARINSAIKDKSFFDFPVWKKAVAHAEKNNSAIHLIGLLSNGGVHSHITHLFAILRAIKNLEFSGRVFIHIFTDGRDTAPKSAEKFIGLLKEEMERIKIGKIASIAGRYYAMDRDENWERTGKAYQILIGGGGEKAASAPAAAENFYKNGLSDEMFEPTTIIEKENQPVGAVQDNDAAIFFNFRPDRARQLTQAFIAPEFGGFKRKKLDNLLFVTLTRYADDYSAEIVFEPQYIAEPLAKVIADAGKTQLHIAETEKYAHITYFLNGATEKEFSGEVRILIPSKKVKSFDEQPEMSASEITEKIIAAIKKQEYDFIAVNFANADMVGHTGNLEASVKAVEFLDECVGRIKNAVLEAGGVLAITADHGNAEEMLNLATGEIDKEHSTNPVPFWIVGADNKITEGQKNSFQTTPQGILADVAPTILEIMELPKPKEMTGNSLLKGMSRCPLPK